MLVQSWNEFSENVKEYCVSQSKPTDRTVTQETLHCSGVVQGGLR